MENKYIILGDGLLGSEIIRQTGWKYISRKKDGFDITNFKFKHFFTMPATGYNYTIVNCIGFTDTYSEDKEKHFAINYKGVINIANVCRTLHAKLIHISTDYVYGGNPAYAKETDLPIIAPNWYTYSKLLADEYIQRLFDEDYLIVRTSFKPKPFPYEKATITQVGNFDYVDVIAKLIIQLIKQKASGMYNVGTSVKTMLQLAEKTRPDIKPLWGKIHPTMPTNIIMDLTKMNREIYK